MAASFMCSIIQHITNTTTLSTSQVMLVARLYYDKASYQCGHVIPWNPHELMDLNVCPVCRAPINHFVQERQSQREEGDLSNKEEDNDGTVSTQRMEILPQEMTSKDLLLSVSHSDKSSSNHRIRIQFGKKIFWIDPSLEQPSTSSSSSSSSSTAKTNSTTTTRTIDSLMVLQWIPSIIRTMMISSSSSTTRYHYHRHLLPTCRHNDVFNQPLL